MITGELVGAAVTTAWLERKIRAVELAEVAIVNEGLVIGTMLVKANASGRPGPNIRTGDYVRSIRARPVTRPGQTGYIGSPRPQAARLELGFYGRDSLGRQYAQPPFPHFAPAAAELRIRYPQIGRVHIRKALAA